LTNRWSYAWGQSLKKYLEWQGTNAGETASVSGELVFVLLAAPMATSSNSSVMARYETARQMSLAYLIIIGTFGILSNSLVVVVFIKHDKLRTATNLFILNLPE